MIFLKLYPSAVNIAIFIQKYIKTVPLTAVPLNTKELFTIN